MKQITSAETQTSYICGCIDVRQHQHLSSQYINFMSQHESKGKENSVMLWANTGMDSCHCSRWRKDKIRAGRTLSTSLREQKFPVRKTTEMRTAMMSLARAAGTAAVRTQRRGNFKVWELSSWRLHKCFKVRLQRDVYCPCTKDLSRRPVILGKGWFCQTKTS